MGDILLGLYIFFHGSPGWVIGQPEHDSIVRRKPAAVYSFHGPARLGDTRRFEITTEGEEGKLQKPPTTLGQQRQKFAVVGSSCRRPASAAQFVSSFISNFPRSTERQVCTCTYMSGPPGGLGSRTRLQDLLTLNRGTTLTQIRQ